MVHIGKSYPIHDAVAKSKGRTIYTGDMELQGMLHMALLFSPIPHGIVKSLDCKKALEFPGVVDVVHCFNTKQTEYNRNHREYRQALVHDEQVFNAHVRFVGDRVAGVIAQTEEIARKAVKLIDVVYEELPFSINMLETLKGKAGQIHKEGNIYGDFVSITGDEPDGKDFVEICTVTDLSRINHLCMETHACVADYERSSGQLTVYSPCQTVFGIRTLLGDIFEMDYNNIRVIKTVMGGSFGGKQEYILEPAVAAGAIKVGRPVRLVYNRKETIISTICRAPMHFKSSFKFSRDGCLQGVDCDLTLDAGAYLGNSYKYIIAMASKFFRVYKYPYCKYTSRAVVTNTIVNGAFRGWTAPEETIMFEHNMNMAAKELNIDPVDLRIKNVMLPENIDPISNVSLGNFRIKEALELGRNKFHWDKRKTENEQFNLKNNRYKRGIGVSLGGHSNSYYPSNTDFTRVEMRLTESGTVKCNMTLHDHGCGTITALKMIVAEELGLSIDQVKISEGDTDVTPFDVGCFASRTTFVVGKAACECAKKLKERMKQHVHMLDGIDVDDLVIENQTVYSKSDEGIHYSWSDLVHRSHQLYRHEIFVSYEYAPETNPGVAGAHFALVEVDTYTGMARILNYLAVHDIGKAINRELCIAQTQGAVIMGSGAALCEQVIIQNDGTPKGLIKDYHLINCFEAPEVQVEFIEEGHTEGPYGAKSIGEVSHAPVTAAIVGAVNDALQSDMNSIPLSPDTILNYLNTRGDSK